MTEPTPDRPHEELTAPPPPEGVLDAARRAALEAFDEGAAAPAVADLGTRRDRRAGWATRVPLGAVAAAVVLVALVGVFVSAADLGDTDDDMDTATAQPEADGSDEDDSADDASSEAVADADEPGGDLESGAASGGTSDDGSAFDAGEAPPTRRAYVDLDAFIADLADPVPTAGEDAAPPASTTTAPADACDPVPVAGVDASSVRRIVPGTVDGRPLLAVVYDPDGASEDDGRVAVVDEFSCSLVADRAL